MFDLRPYLAVGVLINSALYFIGVLVTALMHDNRPALYLDLVAIGLTYLSHLVSLGSALAPESVLMRRASQLFPISTIVLGTIAGLALL